MADPYEFLMSRYRTVVRTDAWRAHDPEWRSRARSRLATLLGVVGEPWPDDAPSVGPPAEATGCIRRWVEFPSRSGWHGSGWLLIPDGQSAPAPAVICLPGHGAGADALVGLIDEPYQAAFARQCVERGWVALAVEQVAFGHNRSARAGQTPTSCVMDSMFALQLGETMTGWRVRDAIAAARFLQTLPEVDGERIATLGISGGGLTALFSTALDEAICAAGVSGYFTPMADSILRFDHCPDNYIPGLAMCMDVPDLAGLVAPRWLAVENGVDDPIFAIEGFREACRRTADIYAAAGAQERFSSAELSAGHVFDGACLFESLESAFAAAR